jgi:hypothetical protein
MVFDQLLSKDKLDIQRFGVQSIVIQLGEMRRRALDAEIQVKVLSEERLITAKKCEHLQTKLSSLGSALYLAEVCTLCGGLSFAIAAKIPGEFFPWPALTTFVGFILVTASFSIKRENISRSIKETANGNS